ncbi:ie2 [Choristoneura murinana nucleopolyhedrovirus]|uniref:Ie2 n=1 Tax=Choristoneura murinana nucleopolyhedrovirus TaxID=1987479 RepID=V9XVA3_9ABAC|nr:ie2 [Choristoneura murinana nucleopolyhedrovirus]AHD25523.1 ie2 [Choristoneura murinana nucleopolyhedrovirus]
MSRTIKFICCNKTICLKSYENMKDCKCDCTVTKFTINIEKLRGCVEYAVYDIAINKVIHHSNRFYESVAKDFVYTSEIFTGNTLEAYIIVVPQMTCAEYESFNRNTQWVLKNQFNYEQIMIDSCFRKDTPNMKQKRLRTNLIEVLLEQPGNIVYDGKQFTMSDAVRDHLSWIVKCNFFNYYCVDVMCPKMKLIDRCTWHQFLDCRDMYVILEVFDRQELSFIIHIENVYAQLYSRHSYDEVIESKVKKSFDKNKFFSQIKFYLRVY